MLDQCLQATGSQHRVGHRRHWNIGLVHVSRLDLLHHNRRHVKHGCKRWSDVTVRRSRGLCGPLRMLEQHSPPHEPGAALETNSTTGAEKDVLRHHNRRFNHECRHTHRKNRFGRGEVTTPPTYPQSPQKVTRRDGVVPKLVEVWVP